MPASGAASTPPCPESSSRAGGIGRHLQASLAPPFTNYRNAADRGLRNLYPPSDTTHPASVADPAGIGRGSGVGGGGSGLGSPVSERHGISTRKRNASLAGFDSSPGTIESPEADGSEDGHQDDRRKQPVKRACNECRQQKVSYS